MTEQQIKELLRERILVLDGGLGTMVQSYGLGEEEFRGERFKDWKMQLKGCNDLLVLTRPDVIREIHGKYLMVGADIITTDTFNANPVSLSDYGLEEYAYEISKAAAQVARGVADQYTARNPHKPRLVSGSVGPTNVSLSISADINRPESRAITFEKLSKGFEQQIEGLVDGGVDIVQLETFFDTLNCKAAIYAAQNVFRRKGRRVPMIISGTLTSSGRTLSGQTVDAFYTSVEHARPLAVSLNCSFGAAQLLPYVKQLSEVSRFAVCVYPNAGLPNLAGGYDETPAMMAEDMKRYFEQRIVNIVGGCCGTTPAHIAELVQAVKGFAPRELTKHEPIMTFSGLERVTVTKESNFVNIGERTNVAGSAKFAKLVREDKFDEALGVARSQVEAGAQIVDLCFDDGMIDGVKAMTKFLNLAAGEVEVSKVPFMIDSSSWSVIEAGLGCAQGKCIVNSISLKEGEEKFLQRAATIRQYGAAAVVMLFDERGQADTYERKIEVAQRAYNLLQTIGFEQTDLIFDPNVLAVATGIAEHDKYAKDFIEACRWIRNHYPNVGISGGVSNLSFAFRGINQVRQAMHSVFLYHAIEAGMNMGIVNPAMVTLYDDIDPELLELTEDVILARRTDAGERLATYAQKVKNRSEGTETVQHEQWRECGVEKRIEYAMLKGISDHIAEDTVLAARDIAPLEVIDRCFMPAMSKVGELFGEGKMFLPQVVKSARVMRCGMDALLPLIGSNAEGQKNKSGKILIATVKGDVHDIGKNIVSVVMECNGYEVNDLGVMVACERIADEAQRWGADAVGLSGLITPSLEEMMNVAREFERRGLKIPIIIGGATTSPLHTAVKIAPLYSGVVIHSRDASGNINILNRLFSAQNDDYVASVKAEQEVLRRKFEDDEAAKHLIPLAKARERRYVKPLSAVVKPQQTGVWAMDCYSIADFIPYIDWNFFFAAWELPGRFPEILEDPAKGESAKTLWNDARMMLERMEREEVLKPCGAVGILPAGKRGDDIVIEAGGKEYSLPQLRNQSEKGETNLSLVDYVCDEGDWIGMFALSAGVGLKEFSQRLKNEGDEYGAIMAKLLTDRLSEAMAEVVHERLRHVQWGYQDETLAPKSVVKGEYQGLRMAFGYPACPEHRLKRTVFDVLDIERTTPLRLTENYMISPGESLCGFVFADKQMKYFSVGAIDDEQRDDYDKRMVQSLKR